MKNIELPLELAEFKRLLDIGLGRAILFLQRNDPTPYRDVILNACLHDMAFDPQVEDTRAAYMAEVIEQTGQSAFYRNQILLALQDIHPDAVGFDIDQLLDFAEYFALRGDSEALTLLYRHFSDNTFDEENVVSPSATKIIEADGLRGFLFVASRLGELLLADGYTLTDDYFLKLIKGKVGEDAVELSLQQSDDPRLTAYMTRALALQEKRKRHQKQPRPNLFGLTYVQVKARLSEPKVCFTMLSDWGKQAAASDLMEAAHDLQSEKDPEKLRQYMSVFRRTDFPLTLDLLFSLAHHEDDWTARIAVSVLRYMAHPSIRAFALESIEQFYLTGDMAGLLIKNYQDGDWQLIERLTKRDLDRQDYHDLQWSIRHFYDSHPSSEAIPVFLTLYDRGPCANCRQKFIEYLQALNAVPIWMIEECHYDSNTEIREMFGEKPSN